MERGSRRGCKRRDADASGARLFPIPAACGFPRRSPPKAAQPGGRILLDGWLSLASPPRESCGPGGEASLAQRSDEREEKACRSSHRAGISRIAYRRHRHERTQYAHGSTDASLADTSTRLADLLPQVPDIDSLSVLVLDALYDAHQAMLEGGLSNAVREINAHWTTERPVEISSDRRRDHRRTIPGTGSRRQPSHSASRRSGAPRGPPPRRPTQRSRLGMTGFPPTDHAVTGSLLGRQAR